MRIGAYSFRPSLIPTLATLVVFPILLSLGFWQLDRAEQKRDWETAREQGRSAPVVNLNHVQPLYAESQQRQAEATGRFDPDRHFILDNQIRHGRAGYRIFTPLLLENSERAILVDRGWVPADFDRSRLPDVAVDGSEVQTLLGRIDRGPSVGMRMGVPGDGEGWPERILYIDFEYMQERLPYPLMPYMLRPSEAEPEEITASMPPEKHVGYAVQWFALAGTLMVIYLTVNFKRERED
ncbi:hypothetical protein CAI21_00590 [Alkalilimnicola ehrlichii]|uniref:SURF1-like protein n=1 Tax=Alkalilimnicola ehrlichii TaxID=351052 RepID=A0A3E0X3V2_9GAMM|nr:SURF1 family protein [Alkalilimnicola ehrlichii]RFA31185.1 hypothetical protein CAI21_00590 [Alkalilimnicola ehrlichii]RFA39532.1 hypothetical protein CAL65_01815 [Alkalilimnicola ehrlichii]